MSYTHIEKKYYKTGELARILGLSAKTIRQKCELGQIEGAFRFPGVKTVWLIPVNSPTLGGPKPKPKPNAFPPGMTIRQKLEAIQKGLIKV